MQVLCLHSSQSSGAQWRLLKRELAVRAPAINVLTPDLIGYGQEKYGPSHPPIAEFRLQHEAALLQPLLDNLLQNRTSQHAPLHLVGHSYGGALTLHLARYLIAKGTPPASISLYEPVAFHVLERDDVARREIECVSASMETLGVAEAAATFVDYWNHPGYFSALPARVQMAMVAKQPKVLADFSALMSEPAKLADYQSIKCPVLLQHGLTSPQSSRRVAELLSSVLPNVQVQAVEGGHMAPVVTPDLVNPGIIDFITRLLF